MMHRSDYREAWEKKQTWYAKNGVEVGENLFVSQDDENGGLDGQAIAAIIDQIVDLVSF
jgi:hypothetical protein